jgi:3-hydroxyacyl-[acyl-carrier-protein] dehydratase
MNIKNIIDLIPQRSPFLFLDEIIEYTDSTLTAHYFLKPTLDVFTGHFPNDPIFPGVLSLECCFQATAALMALRSGDELKQTAVVSRVQNAKFKNIARPDQNLTIKVELKEMLGQAAFMKGKITDQNNKTIVDVEFACTLVESVNNKHV